MILRADLYILAFLGATSQRNFKVCSRPCPRGRFLRMFSSLIQKHEMANFKLA